MEVQLQQLRYFVAVAEIRHFTHAADSLNVSQPTLSKQIHTLEETLGAPLFERVRGAVALTAAGETLLPLARRMVADADAARDAVQEIVGLRRGRVRVGATPSLCSSLVPMVLRRFRTEHPDIELHVNEGSSQDLITDLLARDLDLALIVYPEGEPVSAVCVMLENVPGGHASAEAARISGLIMKAAAGRGGD